LSGLAPISRQSGKWKGRAFIQAGRSIVRKALYMPALVAMRFNPDLAKNIKTLFRQENHQKSPSPPSCENSLSSLMLCSKIIENGQQKILD